MLGTIPYVKQNQNEFRNKTRMITLFSIVSTDILYIYGNKPCQADHGSFLGTSERKNKFVIVFQNRVDILLLMHTLVVSWKSLFS